MSVKRQHFVPRVYIKSWETIVETSKEPHKKFKGVYAFNNSTVAEGVNKDSILWKPRLYTINFRYSYICQSCPKVKNHFVNKIYDLLKNNFQKPIYGKLGYSIIKTRNSINKHFYDIDDWEFYYEDGNVARKSAIKKQIEELNCYILEESFDKYLEKNWEDDFNKFVDSVHNGIPVGIGKSERIISMEVANNIINDFFIMFCRNPKFDAMGAYTRIKNNILYPIFTDMCCAEETERILKENKEIKNNADELITGLWYSELYKMFFKEKSGFYNNVVKFALLGCQMILYETYDGAGYFITSDNPAFEHILMVERKNNNGMIFPLSPKYLLFIAKGSDAINIVDYRFANTDTIKYFNKIILQHKSEIIVANQKQFGILI